MGSSLPLRPCEVLMNNANNTPKLKLSIHSIEVCYPSYSTYSSIYFCVEHHGICYLTIIKCLPLAPLFLQKELNPYLNGGAPFWHDIITFKDKQGRAFFAEGFFNWISMLFHKSHIKTIPKILNENLKIKKKSKSQAMGEISNSNRMIEFEKKCGKPF